MNNSLENFIQRFVFKLEKNVTYLETISFSIAFAIHLDPKMSGKEVILERYIEKKQFIDQTHILLISTN